MKLARDHGGRLSEAIARFGGDAKDWIDLSTGINPTPYSIPPLPQTAWTNLPDEALIRDLEDAARQFWNVPEGAEVVAAPGASALIATIPRLFDGNEVNIPQPTYNEHAAAFENAGWTRGCSGKTTVLVNPNNPDGRVWSDAEVPTQNVVIDESFCDVMPEKSLISHAISPGCIILKSFGKFWGLAGLRLGFAICLPDMAIRLREALGPWAVSGPACHTGTAALCDPGWANEMRGKLADQSDRLDAMLSEAGLKLVGGTTLFRLASVEGASVLQQHLAAQHILTRVFPYSDNWVRFGLPATASEYARLEAALKTRP